MLQPNTVYANRYLLNHLLGRGGFAEVWLATDNKTGLQVALKIYAPGTGLDEDGIKLFMDEYALVFNLNHTNLLRPTYFDEEQNRPYLVMPYCEKGSTQKLIGKMSEAEAWHFLHDVAAGLAYLHSRQTPVIHQDIKPDNILINSQGDYLITDFGISTKIRSTLRKSAMQKQQSSGTLAYMAPERFSADNRPIMAGDVWSLGATLHELLTGDVPFGEEGGLMEKRGVDIPLIYGNYSDALKNIVRRCMAPEPWDRPTAHDIARIAGEVMEGKTSNASQPAGGGFQGRSQGQGGYQGQRGNAGGPAGTQPAGGGFQGQGGPQGEGGYQGQRGNAGGPAGTRPAGGGFQGQGGSQGQGGYQGAASGSSSTKPKFHWAVWTWLSIILLVNSFLAVMFLFPIEAFGMNDSFFIRQSFIVAFLFGLNVIAAILMCNAKRIGFFLFIASQIIALLVEYSNNGLIWLIVSAGILFAVLQIKKNGISAWDVMGQSRKTNRGAYLLSGIVVSAMAITALISYPHQMAMSEGSYGLSDDSLAVPSDSLASVDWVRIADDNNKFSVLIPGDWTSQQLSTRQCMGYGSPDDNYYMLALCEDATDVYNAGVSNLDEYYNLLKENFNGLLSNYHPITKTDMKIYGERGIMQTYSGSIKVNDKYIECFFEKLYLKTDNFYVILQCWSPLSLKDEAEPKFDKMVLSYQTTE